MEQKKDRPRPLDEHWTEGPEEEYYDDFLDDGFYIDEDEDFRRSEQDGWRVDGQEVKAEYFPDENWTEADWQQFFADDEESELPSKEGLGLPRWMVRVFSGLVLLAFIVVCFPLFDYFSARWDFLGENAALRKEAMVQEALQAVVSIVASADDSAVPERSGTGFFITADGWLLSNAHVTGAADRLKIETAEGKTYFTDDYQPLEGFDVAVIKVELEDSPYIDMEFDITPRAADDYTIVGNPLGFLRVATRGPMVGLHYMSGTSEEEWVFELDASIRPGSSGSPVLNRAGDAVGIIFATRFTTVDGETNETALAVPLLQVEDELRSLGIIE